MPDPSAKKAVPKNPGRNYVLRVRLARGSIVSPPIERMLSCPALATFHQLHVALQIAFGWALIHKYDFIVHDPAGDLYAQPEISIVEAIQRAKRQDMGMPENEWPGKGPKALLRLVEEGASRSPRHPDAVFDHKRRHVEAP